MKRAYGLVSSRAMTATENKRLMQQIFELSHGNERPFLEAVADDVTWTITGGTTWSGTYRGRHAVQRQLLVPLSFSSRTGTRPPRTASLQKGTTSYWDKQLAAAVLEVPPGQVTPGQLESVR